ncbi:restriction endonuclease [Streptomyces sp. CA-252508]|uniref:restriction endonuclease n=1 Tax=Streptomyces sp. CA-252508 TaxID=3418946 RepID=UPI003D8F7D67
MSRTTTVLYDPDGHIEAELPLDRTTHQCLIKAVLAWKGDPSLQAADYHQIALQLTGAARSVATDVRRAAGRLPERRAARALAEYVLDDADLRLTAPLEGTARCAQDRARIVRSLYERLDRLTELAPAPAS